MTTRSKHIYEQRFRRKEVAFSIRFAEEGIFICSDNASKALLAKLMCEIVYDGYVETGKVTDGQICLSNPDLWNCCEDELKDLITSKLEDENYEVTFLS